MRPQQARALVLARTRPQRPPAVPELELLLADDMDEAWASVQRELDDGALPPPFWAFAWIGGQALARHVLDRPGLVRGRRVVDLATGSGLCALAAARAGARSVLAVDIDPVAVESVRLNAQRNGLRVDARHDDPLDRPPPQVDVVLAGDVWYDAELAERVLPWLAQAADQGALVLLGDPGRHYLPRGLMSEQAVYDVPTTRELEGVAVKRVRVYALAPTP